jgi:uncharacterized membrane protein (UPF0127 family)
MLFRVCYDERRVARLLFAALIFTFAALQCAAGGAVGGAKNGPRFEVTSLTIETSGGVSIPLSVEIANTDEQREYGLMHRKSLDDGKGMLFVFERDQILSFWMKNTLIPLSIAFISADGRILEIHDMEPQDTRSIHSSRSARYALEVPQGWFNRAGVSVGDVARIVIPSGHV